MTASSSEVAKTGRVAERSRFRHPGEPRARAAAFQAESSKDVLRNWSGRTDPA